MLQAVVCICTLSLLEVRCGHLLSCLATWRVLLLLLLLFLFQLCWHLSAEDMFTCKATTHAALSRLCLWHSRQI